MYKSPPIDRAFRRLLRRAVTVGLALVTPILSAQPRLADLRADQLTPLDLYVRAPDPHYEFEVVSRSEDEQATTFVVRLVSQAWLSEEHVADPVWWHWLTIVVPRDAATDVAMLYIGGGSNEDPQPEGPGGLLRLLATRSKAVVAELSMIPNQPLRFMDDDGGRSEDAIIAYGWDRFLRGGARDADAEWLLRLPMTKAAVRAMDTVQSVLADSRPVARWVVAGGSKRGWTTWTTAAVDGRVVAIVPLVIDLLNVEESFGHHWRAYGFWAPAVGDYKTEGIMEWQGRPEYARLLEITEPFSYRDRLALPKLLINASGDEFFLPDSWRFYWDDLIGEKHLRYVPNAGHSLAETDVPVTVANFLASVAAGEERPDYQWTAGADRIEVVTPEDAPPTRVSLWQAHNPKTRDFRVVRIKKTWTEQELDAVEPGRWVADLVAPDQGWMAAFVELTYGEGAAAFKVTSGVRVVPEELPHPDYVPDTSTLPPRPPTPSIRATPP